MGEIKSPVRIRELEGALGVLFRSLVARGSKRELLDTEKMIAINLKKGGSIALMDRNDDFWELSKNRKGQYHLKRLNKKKLET
jgi:hypothetical protein